MKWYPIRNENQLAKQRINRNSINRRPNTVLTCEVVSHKKRKSIGQTAESFFMAKQGRYSVGEERARMVTLSDDERASDDERPPKIERQGDVELRFRQKTDDVRKNKGPDTG